MTDGDGGTPGRAAVAAPPAGDTGDRRASVAVRHVDHWYGARRGAAVHALADVSLEVPAGSFASLIGASGCGKSTLLKIVGGLMTPTSGETSIDGKLVRGPEQETGYMFQDATLLAWRSAIENVLLPIEIRFGRAAAKQARPRAQDLLERTGLGEFANALPHQLSGGMAQRVAICRMLVSNPSLLLMDEPFGALDELTRDSMNEELYRLCSEWGATSIMVTHSIPEAVFLSHVVYVMSPRPGRISRVIEIDLPHPRRLGETTVDPRYAELVQTVREALDAPEPAIAAGGG